MRILFSISALLAAIVSAPAHSKPSFDCNTARLPAELTICQISNLGEADADLARMYTEILKYATDSEKAEIRDDQRNWLKTRNACEYDIACLLTVMSDRRFTLGRRLNDMRDRVPSWTLFKPSFTCTERSKDVEKAICSSEHLASSDRELAEAYKSALERVGAQGVDQLKSAQRSWVTKRNGCRADSDCIAQAMEDRIAELENTLGPAPSLPLREGKSAAVCNSDAAMLARAAGSVTVTLRDPGGVKAGEPIRISWRRGDWRVPEDTSVHLVLVFPEWVRFGGKYLLPLPPGAPAPASLKYALDKMRVVLPLTSAHAPRADEIAVKPYRAGPLRMEYVLVAKSSCGETVIKSGQLPEVPIDAGALEIVTQDFFTLEKPEQTIISNNGRFRLEVFPGSYRVFDVATGLKIADRVGIDPNFSPEARFVGAYVSLEQQQGRQLELFDLVARAPVSGMILYGPSIGWALSDGVLIAGTSLYQEIRVYRTLIDDHGPIDAVGTSQHIEVDGAKGYAWSHFQLALYPEPAIIAISSGMGTSIFDLASFNPTNSGRELAESASSVKLQDIRNALLKDGVTNFKGFNGWQADGPVRLSHLDEEVEFGVAGNEDRFKGTILPSSRLVRHSGTAAAAVVPVGSKSAIVASADWRARTTAKSLASKDDTDLSRFAERLAEFGVCVDKACKGIPKRNPVENFVASSTFNKQANFINWDHVADFTRSASNLQSEIVRDVPAAFASIAPPDEDLGWHEFPEDSDRRDRRVRFRLSEEPEDYSGINGLWRWSVDGRNSWLTQQVYGSRGGLNASSVVMYLGDQKSGGKIVNLSAADRNDDDPDGLHKHFMGERSNPLLRVRPFLYDNRWLLIAAPAGSSAAIVDLQRPEPPTFLYRLEDVHDTRYLLRTHDGRRLVQLNTDGRFHIYEIPSGILVVSGRYVDDEIIFYTPEGYYWSSYEGAHYVHARFQGRDGLYSLQQFASALDRPDVVKAAIAGTASAWPNPEIQVPPGLEFAVNKIGDTRIELAVAANASAKLKELRVYQDGKPTGTLPVSGATFKAAITVERELQALWLTVVAVDMAGLTSVPVTAKIDAPQRAANTLHLLAVGVDEYDHLNPLAFAKVDAETLVAAATSVQGSYYADVQPSLLRDRAATADQILESLAAKASEARTGDTLMLFFAGHGARSSDGRFFMTTSATRVEDLDGTALEWSRIAAVLSRTKARVIVVLDACHSGQTGAQLSATNDDAVAAISGASRTPMLVIAASKGRQLSEELGGAGGGVFTQVLAKLITQGRDDQDLNRNGILELSEIFRGLKEAVTTVTNGRQTPWLVRQEMVGDFAVF